MAARVGRLYVAAAFMAARERGAGVSRMPPKGLRRRHVVLAATLRLQRFGGTGRRLKPAATKVQGTGRRLKPATTVLR